MKADRTRPANAFVGSPIERIEDLRFLSRQGQYVDDLSAPGLLHAVVVRSSVAHGRIHRMIPPPRWHGPACMPSSRRRDRQRPDHSAAAGAALRFSGRSSSR